MDIDFWVRESFGQFIHRAAHHLVADRSGWPGIAQGRQAVNWHRVNYRKNEWEARILLLEPHELCLGQGRQVR